MKKIYIIESNTRIIHIRLPCISKKRKLIPHIFIFRENIEELYEFYTLIFNKEPNEIYIRIYIIFFHHLQ